VGPCIELNNKGIVYMQIWNKRTGCDYHNERQDGIWPPEAESRTSTFIPSREREKNVPYLGKKQDSALTWWHQRRRTTTKFTVEVGGGPRPVVIHGGDLYRAVAKEGAERPKNERPPTRNLSAPTP